ncbi:MAG: hypothetical protein K8U03_19150 [Planctomycetia bacterium]|nr:hypothetical protein [Planctomycetia bacterium]
MATVVYPNDATFAPAALPLKTPVAKLETIARRESDMDADDAAALRIVSAIIFTVVALGTLAMLGTVLICG